MPLATRASCHTPTPATKKKSGLSAASLVVDARVIAAPGITRPLAYLQTIEITQCESRAPTGETLFAGQSTSPKIELATTCTKAVKSGFTSL
jgi:hypothetical protein